MLKLVSLLITLCLLFTPFSVKAQQQPPVSPSRVFCQLTPEATALCIWVWGSFVLTSWAVAPDPPPQPINRYELRVDNPHAIEILPLGSCGFDCYIVRLTYDMDTDRCWDMFAVDVYYEPVTIPTHYGWVRSINQVTQGDETKVDVRVIPAPGNWQNELSSYRHAIFVCQVLDQ